MFKIKLTKKPKTGSQADYGLITNSTFVPTVSDREKVKQTMGSITEEDMKNGKRPTIEVEGEEEVIGDIGGRGVLQKFRFKGPSHAEGGMPVDIPQGSFVYSKKLKMKDPAAQEAFGMKPKKEGYSFSDVAKKYDINTFVNTLENPEADPFAKRTAQLMLQKNTESLAKLADKQEETKGYPGGRAEITKQVLGVPDVPAQVEDVPPTMDEAACGGSMRKAQWGESVNLVANTLYPSVAAISRFANSDNDNYSAPKKETVKPKNTSTKGKPTNNATSWDNPYNEALNKAGIMGSDFANEYPKLADQYAKTFASKDPLVLKKFADEIEANRDITGEWSGVMDMFPGSDSDKISDMASILREKAGQLTTKSYLDKAKELQKRAYQHYKTIQASDKYDYKTEAKAKEYAENLDRTVKKLQTNLFFDVNRAPLREGEIGPETGGSNYLKPETISYIDKAYSKIQKENKSGIQKLKGREEFDYKYDPKNKVWTYSNDKTGGKFYEVTNLDSVKRLNKGEGYTYGTKEKSVLPVEEDKRSNAVYDEGLEKIKTSPEEKVVVKKQVVNQRPVVQKQVQQVEPAEMYVPDFSEFAYGGELPHYQSDVAPATVTPSKTIAKTTVGVGTASKKPVTNIVYTDGSEAYLDEQGKILKENPATPERLAYATSLVKSQPVATTTTAKPVGTPAPMPDYTQDYEQLKTLLNSNPALGDAMWKKFQQNYPEIAQGTTKEKALETLLEGQRQNTILNSKFSQEELSTKDWDTRGKNNYYNNTYNDYAKRAGITTPMHPDQIKVFEGMYTGANDVANDPAYMETFRNAGFDVAHTGNLDAHDSYKGANITKVTGTYGNTLNRQFLKLDPNRNKPKSEIETIPEEKPKEEPSKDKFEGEPGEPLEKMPEKTPGWYLQDYVNFGAALGQKTADFRPVKGSVNASMSGYTLEDPTTAQNTLQANQGRVQDQIENTTAGNVGTAVAISAAAENAANSARIASESEGKNTGITNQAFAQNAAIQNQQATTNAGLLDKFVTDSANFGNAKVKEENMKNAQIAEMFNAGTEHEFKRKANEQVLFPQTAMNPITGDWYAGGKGRDIFGPDTYSPAYASQKGKLKDYEEFGQDYDNALNHFTEKGYSNPDVMAKEYANKRIKQDDNYALNNKQLMMQALLSKMFGGSI